MNFICANVLQLVILFVNVLNAIGQDSTKSVCLFKVFYGLLTVLLKRIGYTMHHTKIFSIIKLIMTF